MGRGSPPKATRFKKGQSGNPAGRPRSARSRISERFLEALAEKFDEVGEKALASVAKDEPGQFLKLVASVLPKHLETTGEDGAPVGVNQAPAVVVTEAEMAALLGAAREDEAGAA